MVARTTMTPRVPTSSLSVASTYNSSVTYNAHIFYNQAPGSNGLMKFRTKTTASTKSRSVSTATMKAR